MYSITILQVARKDIKKIDKQFIPKIKEKILSLSDDQHPAGSLKLTNQDVFRVRSGNYRIIYLVDDYKKEVIVTKVKHRKDAYI